MSKNLDINASVKGGEKLNALEKQLLALAKSQDSITKSTKGYDAQARRISDTLIKYESGTKKVAIEVKKLDGELKKVTKTVINQDAALKKQKEAFDRASQAAANFNRAVRPNAKGTTQELFNLQAAENSLTALVQKHNVSYTQIQSIWKKLSSGEIHHYKTQVERDLVVALNRVRSAHDKMGASARKAHTAASNAAAKQAAQNKKAADSADSLRRKIDEMHLSWQSVIRILSVQALQNIFFDLIGAIKESIVSAQDLSIAIAEIQTLLKDSENPGFGAISEQLRELSDLYTGDILLQTEAYYQTLSNQVGDAADAVTFLSAANRLAVATVSDVNVAVNALSSVLNSYNLDASNAADISAKYFNIIKFGRVRLEEMSDSIGQLTITGGQLGIKFEEVGAAIATVTVQGLKYNEAATQLRGVMQALLKPTEAMQDFLRSLGVTTAQEAISLYGFSGVMEQLGIYTKGNTTLLAEMIPRVRGLSGTLAILSREGELYNNNLKEISQSTDEYNKKVDDVLANAGKSFQREMERIRNFFTQDVGQGFLEDLNALGDEFGGLSQIVIGFTKIVLENAVPAIGALSGALATLAVASLTNPVTAAIVGSAAAVAVVQRLINGYVEDAEKDMNTYTRIIKTAKKNTEKELSQMVSAWQRSNKNITDSINGITNDLNNSAASVSKDLQKIESAFEAYGKNVEIEIKRSGQSITDAIKAERTKLEDELKEIDKAINDAIKEQEDAKERLRELRYADNFQNLALNLDKLSDPQDKLNLVNKAISDVLETIRNAPDAKTLEDYKRALEDLIEIREGITGEDIDTDDSIQKIIRQAEVQANQSIVEAQRQRINEQIGLEWAKSDELKKIALQEYALKTQLELAYQALKDKDTRALEANIESIKALVQESGVGNSNTDKFLKDLEDRNQQIKDENQLTEARKRIQAETNSLKEKEKKLLEDINNYTSVVLEKNGESIEQIKEIIKKAEEARKEYAKELRINPYAQPSTSFEEIDDLKELLSQLESIDITKATITDIEVIKGVAETLKELADSNALNLDAETFNAARRAYELLKIIQEADLSDKNYEIQLLQSEQQTLNSQIEQFNDSLQGYMGNVEALFESTSSKAESLADNLWRAVQAAERLSSVDLSNVSTASSGYAVGGFPDTDRSFARVDPSEFIMPKAQSSRFAPELRLMRSNVSPSIINNTNSIGDLNFNLEGGGDARSIASQVISQIKRAQRIGTLS